MDQYEFQTCEFDFHSDQFDLQMCEIDLIKDEFDLWIELALTLDKI